MMNKHVLSISGEQGAGKESCLPYLLTKYSKTALNKFEKSKLEDGLLNDPAIDEGEDAK